MYALGLLFYDTPISMVTLQLVQSGGGGRKGVGAAQDIKKSDLFLDLFRIFLS